MKASILGHFGDGANLLNGQTIKTKIITEALCKQLGEDQVLKIDTHGGWKTLLKAPLQVFRALKKSKNVLIFPAHNGLRVYAPLLAMGRLCFRKSKLHYVVIGGWLPEFLKKRKCLSRILKKFDGIYVETRTMKAALENQGFQNVLVMPNCKDLKVLTPEQMPVQTAAPYKLCTFSRVMREKGIADAIEAVIAVNTQLGYQVYSLDIYGQIDPAQEEWFEKLQKDFPTYIHYGGMVPFDQSVEALKPYFALLFPTRFYTEGIPGTIIDAYAAGVPVISARWESFADIIDDGVTGWGYEMEDISALAELLKGIALQPERITTLKEACLNKSKCYIPATAIQGLVEQINNT